MPGCPTSLWQPCHPWDEPAQHTQTSRARMWGLHHAGSKPQAWAALGTQPGGAGTCFWGHGASAPAPHGIVPVHPDVSGS